MKHLKNFVRSQDGVTAIEYALIASLIAVFIDLFRPAECANYLVNSGYGSV
jgi:hypothetical protein